jgi:hypothetical protein
MRQPEKCPWCGAAENIRPDGVRTGTYECGWEIGVTRMRCMSSAYRRDRPWGLSWPEYWRRRLSQHTGVPLRECPEPTKATEHEGHFSGGVEVGEGYIYTWWNGTAETASWTHNKRAAARIRIRGMK